MLLVLILSVKSCLSPEKVQMHRAGKDRNMETSVPYLKTPAHFFNRVSLYWSLISKSISKS